MIIGVGPEKNEWFTMNIGTHDGVFHPDEVVGIAAFIIARIDIDEKIYVVRTRKPEVLNSLSLVIDVGGGEFDHHQPGFNKCRSTGEKYASAGLVWNCFGGKAIENVMGEIGVFLESKYVDLIKEQIDREIILPVDLEDNGEKVTCHLFSFIPNFLPPWMGDPKAEDYNKAFEKVVTIVFNILKEKIKDKIIQVVTANELEKSFKSIADGIMEIPAQSMPWLNDVVKYNQTNNDLVKFVIFPYPAGGWAAQCVPPSVEDKFKQLVPFPKEWAGADEKTLPEISSVPDATFCHNGCFFGRAKNKDAVIKMCRIALGQ